MGSYLIKFCVTLGFLALNGCLFSSDGDGAVDPGSNAAQFRMIPNDKAISDSIAANLAVGVVIPGHPNGSYSLSFPAGSGDIPDLRLYRLYEQSNGYYGYTTDQVVEGQLQDSDWVYEFSSDFTGMVNWLTVLEQNGKRYKKNISDVQLSATGAYSDTLSFNLWVAGKYVAPAGDETPEELADSLLAGFREYYGPTGIVVDTVYTLYAVDHPLIGDEFDSTQTISASGLEDRFDSLGYGLEKPYSKALDIVLVYKFDNDSVLGLSPLFGCNLKAGESGAVVVSTHRINDANKLAGAEVQKIITTMVHEVGHFFGLRHTTVTTDDMEASNDYSILEDGLDDTPWCPGLNEALSTMGVSFSGSHLYSRIRIAGLATAISCKDLTNPMFPYESDQEIGPFSDEQGEILRKNLELFPH